MSGMDRLTDAELFHYSHAGKPSERIMARELLAHRRASQAAPAQPTEAMLDAARDWSDAKYGKPIGDDAAIGCWNAMMAAAPAPSDGLREALERIAEQQMYRSGYDQTDISVEPVLTAAEMQELARAALSASPAQEGGE